MELWLSSLFPCSLLCRTGCCCVSAPVSSKCWGVPSALAVWSITASPCPGSSPTWWQAPRLSVCVVLEALEADLQDPVSMPMALLNLFLGLLLLLLPQLNTQGSQSNSGLDPPVLRAENHVAFSLQPPDTPNKQLSFCWNQHSIASMLFTVRVFPLCIHSLMHESPASRALSSSQAKDPSYSFM